MNKFALLAALGAGIAMASPVSAARTLCTSGPVIDLVAQPCVWSPGPPGNDDEASVEQAIFEATGLNVNLTLYGKSDDNPGLFNFSAGDPENDPATDWAILAGLNVQYVTVKGANEFKVYQLAGAGASSGNVSTVDLLTPNGKNQPGISHISFWLAPTAVPEPATWAMLILGFGMIGGAMRTAGKRRGELTFA